jgi:hypothetical protein
MMSMSKLAILEEYYLKVKKKNQLDLNTVLLNIESSIHNIDERLSKVEVEVQDLKDKFATNPLDYQEKIWVKIRGYAIEAKTSSLLNPSRNYRFHIVETAETFIRVDKLGKVRLTRDMFLTIFQKLREIDSWVKIGASVKNTKPNSVEGYLKSLFFGGDMNAQMTASWVSAILVRSNVGIIFNNKAVGQALKYTG